MGLRNENIQIFASRRWWALAAVLFIPALAWGQGAIGVSTNIAGFFTWQNTVATCSIGGAVTQSTTGSGTTSTAAYGSWQFGATGGDPTNPLGQNYRVIDNAEEFLYSDDQTTEFQIGGASSGSGASGTGSTTSSVNLNTQTGTMSWTNISTTSTSSSTTTNGDQYTVVGTFQLVRDVLNFEYDITNNSPQAHNVAFRLLEEVIWPQNDVLANHGLPATTTSGMSARVTSGKNSKSRPLTGNSRQTTTTTNTFVQSPFYVPFQSPIYAETEYGNTIPTHAEPSVPSQWSVQYPDPANLTADENFTPYWHAVQPLSGAGITTPSILAFANFADLEAYSWNAIVMLQNPSQYQGGTTTTTTGTGKLPVWDTTTLSTDTGVGLYYPIQSLNVGQTRVITGQIKLAWAQVNSLYSAGAKWTAQNLALAVAAPTWLGYRAGTDPNHPTAAVESYYNPSTVQLRAYVFNANSGNAPNCSVSINPGSGLGLVAGQQTSYQVTPLYAMQDTLLAANGNSYSWQLQPTRNVSGQIPVQVTATFTPGGSVTTTAYVNIPALLDQTWKPGLQFVGFPFTFTNSDPRVALGLGPSVDLAWWNPSLSTPGYQYAASTAGLSLTPGQGYWLELPGSSSSTTTISLPPDAQPINQRNIYQVQLAQGWNTISNPFQYAVEWGNCTVFYNSTSLSLQDAVNQALIQPVIWSWDPANGDYEPPLNPSPNDQLTTEMNPYQGFWLYAGAPASLTFNPDPFLPVMNPYTTQARNTRAPGQANNWQVNLLVSTDKAQDRNTVFGVSPTAVNGPSKLNIMKPPVSPLGLSAYFPHPNWGRAAGNYSIEMQPPGAAHTWTLEIYCTRPNASVTLRWPDLTQLPDGENAVLTDTFTGQQVAMRTAPNYTFGSGNGGIRRFTISVAKGGARLRFTSTRALSARAGAGVSLTYTLSSPAVVNIILRTPTGRLLRTLSAAVNTAGVQTTTQWDGRDALGRILPRGVYLCGFTATAPDGESTRSTLQVQIQ